jgi:histone H3/H4
MSLVVKAKIREYAKVDDKVLNVSGDFADKLGEKVEILIKDACRRAKENGRSTVMAKDL